jgi:hypothetical protein
MILAVAVLHLAGSSARAQETGPPATAALPPVAPPPDAPPPPATAAPNVDELLRA